MNANSLSCAFGVFLFFCFVTASHLRPAHPLREWALSRTVAVSNSGPMSAVVNINGTARNATLELVRYFNKVGVEMKKEVAKYNYAYNGLRSICNYYDNFASKTITSYMRTRQLGEWQSDCITELRLGNVENLWNNIAKMQDTLESGGRPLVEQTGLGTLWNQGPFTHYAFRFSSALQTCEIRHVAALRVRGKWAVLGALTSHPIHSLRSRLSRYYLEEYLTNDHGSVGNLRLYVNNSAQVRVNATTIQATWGGRPPLSLFSEMRRYEKNPAIAVAKSTGARFLALADDSTTLANVAITVLPCSLTLIPSALFFNLDTTIHLYFLATDSIACLPLAIKGIEMVRLSGKTIAESSTLVYGLDSKLDLGVAEVWVAKCATKLKLFRFGAALLTVALVAMMVGIALEIYCRVRQQKKNSSAAKPQCTECNYFTVRTASSSGDQMQDFLSVGILSTRLRRGRPVDLEDEIGTF